MTQWERMLAGQLYRADDGDLIARRQRCKTLCQQINALMPEEELQRQMLLRQLLGEAGDGLAITPPFWCDYGENITVGRSFYTNHNCVILDCAPVRFGDGVFVGPNCGFYTAGHPLCAAQRNQGLEFARPITVGDHVWIGGGVQVLPGVTIGSGSVIGAGSVVTRDIPANVVAAGNPCRVLRPITEADRMPIDAGIRD